jgi:hypothetical protein
MQKTWLFLWTIMISAAAVAQQSSHAVLRLQVAAGGAPVTDATVELRKAVPDALVKAGVTDSAGNIVFSGLTAGQYWCNISRVGFVNATTAPFTLEANTERSLPVISLQQAAGTLSGVTVISRKPLIELRADKTIVNLEAGTTQAGTTALEALESMPGITVSREGAIGLKGKSSVLVLLDGKPTYLGSAELATLLGRMSASQISQVEIMSQPPAKYDASGNAGVINIKTKRTLQRSWNGSFTTAFGQGRYPKSNNNLQLNYRAGKVALFLNYALNANRGFGDIYALRNYYGIDGVTIERRLEQFSFMPNKGTTHNLRTGMDYFLTPKTTLGVTLSGTSLLRVSESKANAYWLNAAGAVDSSIETQTDNTNRWKNAGLNLNLRHSISSSRQLSADFDVIGYTMQGTQASQNILLFPGTYTEKYRGDLPSDLAIYSGKADYTDQLSKKTKVEAGWKSSHIQTDNGARYDSLDGNVWKADLGKTNHFLYNETIHALYSSLNTEAGKWNLQGGLRYEATSYKAAQLGNAAKKDSAFSRSYQSLFPTAFVSYKADSVHTFTVSVGRRIDRPAFQKLNPFIFIINAYTNQQGNPYYLPQYTTNFEVSHLFKNLLVTSVSYSRTRDYFSQIFLSDTTTGIIVYTEGNLNRARNLGASIGLQTPVRKWWSFNGQVNYNNKRIEGNVYGRAVATISQMTVNLSNQFRWGKGWGGELSGFYATRSQTDLQEIVDPSGQVSLGVSKTVLKGKGTLRFSMRDIFYTQIMAGNTTFNRSSEYFSFSRDTRVANIAFTYRFGKPIKGAVKRSEGASKEEIQRVGNG